MSLHHYQRIALLFESFTPADIARLDGFYTEDAQFKDPFNDVRGLTAVQDVYRHMFDNLVDPRFRIVDHMVQDDRMWLVWDFHFEFRSVHKGRAQVVRGASYLQLAADGRIQSHRDYWDAAEELYAKLPAIGLLMRWLQRRMAGAS